MRASLRIAAGALLVPGAVTLLALAPVSATTAALAYVVAVAVAALIGGSPAGLGASVVSFLSLNFFFTPPKYTFTVADPQDLEALVVFLVVSALVSALLSRMRSQRAVAERRAAEAGILHELGSRLLAGEPPDEVVAGTVRSVADLLGLRWCRMEIDWSGREMRAEVGTPPPEKPQRIVLESGGRVVGTIEAAASGAPIDLEDRRLLRAVAGQVVLALEGMRADQAARSARADADRSRLQAALLSSVTHDLRTPLASITASVTSLLEEDASFRPEERRELLATIRDEAERLNRLVGNFLDVSRMRAGAVAPTKAPASIEEVVEGVLARLHRTLRTHRVRLLIREDLPDVPMDIVLMDRALGNILENAAKFSPRGSEVTIAAAPWEGGVEVRIGDQGPGIAVEDRARVLEPFVRGEGPDAGTGLGLAIANAVVTAHGGRLRIEPAPGGGTAVTLWLPGNGAYR